MQSWTMTSEATKKKMEQGRARTMNYYLFKSNSMVKFLQAIVQSEDAREIWLSTYIPIAKKMMGVKVRQVSLMEHANTSESLL